MNVHSRIVKGEYVRNRIKIVPRGSLTIQPEEGRQCTRKARYSKQQAIAKAKEILATGRVDAMRIYECIFCNGWHIARDHEHEVKNNWRKK